MATMTLAQALKLKNRLVQRLEKLRSQVAANNSLEVETEREVDVRKAWTEYVAETDRLVALKAAITRANAPIQDAIYRIAELKGRATFLSNLSTTHGKQATPMYVRQENMPAYHEYDAVLRRAEVDALLEALSQEIDALQDQIDAHNHATSVVVPD